MYTVKAGSLPQALGALLPLLSLDRDRYGPQPEIADYAERERSAALTPAADEPPPSGLTKSVYTAREVAEILHISKASPNRSRPTSRRRSSETRVASPIRGDRPARFSLIDALLERYARP